MFQVSNALPKSEALGFAQTMAKRTHDKYFIYLVDENPDARDIVRRESWAVVRYPREGEIVRRCYAGLGVSMAGVSYAFTGVCIGPCSTILPGLTWGAGFGEKY